MSVISTAKALVSRLTAWARGGTGLVQPSAQDRQSRGWFDTIDHDFITSAIRSWGSLGNPRAIGDVFDEMRKMLLFKGVLRQAKAGVAEIETDVVPSTVAGLDATRVEINGDRTRRVWEALKAPLVSAVMECAWEGGGVIGVGWRALNADGVEIAPGELVSELVPFMVEKVAQQRLRRDLATGDLTIAPSSWAFVGEPLTRWPMGAYLVVDPDRHVMAFDRRGTHIGAVVEWWRLGNILGFWADDVEDLETPTVHLRYGNSPDEAVMKSAAANWGNGGKLVTSMQSESMLLAKQGSSGAHAEYEQKTKARVSLGYLGEEQTVSVATDQASKASASEHGEVADSVVAEWWGVICPLVHRQLFEVIALVNEGDRRYAATLDPDLGEEVDSLAVIETYQAGKDLGLEISEEQVREDTGIRKPGPGETPLKKADVPIPPQLAPPQPMEQPTGLRLV